MLVRYRLVRYIVRETKRNIFITKLFIILKKRILFGLLYFYFYYAYVIFTVHRIGIYMYIKILIDIIFLVYFSTNCYFTIDTLDI